MKTEKRKNVIIGMLAVMLLCCVMGLCIALNVINNQKVALRNVENVQKEYVSQEYLEEELEYYKNLCKVQGKSNAEKIDTLNKRVSTLSEAIYEIINNKDYDVTITYDGKTINYRNASGVFGIKRNITTEY